MLYLQGLPSHCNEVFNGNLTAGINKAMYILGLLQLIEQAVLICDFSPQAGLSVRLILVI